jgi:predicted ATPase
MLTEWSIGNFKAIDSVTKLKLAPFTVLTGSNSSGKSSLIQSILMVAQTFAANPRDETIVLNGSLVRLGTLDDILHGGRNPRPLVLEFVFSTHPDSDLVFRVESQLGVKSQQKSVGLSRRTLGVEQSILTFNRIDLNRSDPNRLESNQSRRLLGVRARKDSGGEHPQEVETERELQDYAAAGTFDFQLIDDMSPDAVNISSNDRVVGVEMRGIVPYRLLVRYDAELRRLEGDVQWFGEHLASQQRGRISDRRLSPLFADLVKGGYIRGIPELVQKMEMFINRSSNNLEGRDLLRFLYDSVFEEDSRYRALDLRRRLVSALDEYKFMPRKGSSQRREVRYGYEPKLFTKEYMDAIDQVRDSMSTAIYYLGPLREDPKVMYTQAPFSNRVELGVKGEFTAETLYRWRDKTIVYPLPPARGDFAGEFRKEKGTVQEALLIWLQHMGLLTGIDAAETPKVGYSLRLRNKSLAKDLDLTGVGVGVSQVLPTLVLALIAPVNSVLLYEQPELHLHPKAQSILADFFLGMSMLGKQCIVETHSEYIVNRLRRRIVEAPGDSLVGQAKVFFVEKPDASSIFREVLINEYGVIPEWPKDFFDEIEEESSIILKLQLAKRSKRRSQMDKT